MVLDPFIPKVKSDVLPLPKSRNVCARYPHKQAGGLGYKAVGTAVRHRARQMQTGVRGRRRSSVTANGFLMDIYHMEDPDLEDLKTLSDHFYSSDDSDDDDAKAHVFNNNLKDDLGSAVDNTVSALSEVMWHGTVPETSRLIQLVVEIITKTKQKGEKCLVFSKPFQMYCD